MTDNKQDKFNTTVKQIAEELQVSKVTVHNRIKDLPGELNYDNETIMKGRTLYLSDKLVDFLRGSLEKVAQSNVKGHEKINDNITMQDIINEVEKGIIEQLENVKQQNEDLRKVNESLERNCEFLGQANKSYTEQIKELNEQVKRLHSLLDQQQQLTLVAESKIKEVEKENTLLLEDSKESKKVGFFDRLFSK